MDKEGRSIISYQIRDSLYLNVTNACTADCFFCKRSSEHPVVKGYNLKLPNDPTAQELIDSIGDPSRYKEIVFCGFGEPTLRLQEILQIAKWLKEKGAITRLNTNGHGNLIHKRNIVPDFVNLIDEISISLDVENEEKYLKVVKPKWGKGTFEEVLKFTQESIKLLPKVSVTAVNYPGFDEINFKKFVKEKFGVEARIRAYNQEGD